MAKERLTRDEMSEKYPDQWLGLTDVEWENSANVKSAVVACVGKGKSDLLEMQMDGKIEFSLYTTPNNIFSIGGLTLL